METWRDIPSYEGMYQVSDLGRVKSVRRNKIRKASSGNKQKDYFMVTLHSYGVRRTYGVHQLVAIAFLGHDTSDRKIVVHHKDNNPKNNVLTNLDVRSARDNCRTHVDKTSKYRGVSWRPDINKWHACIQVDYKSVHIGYYVNEEDASEAYQNKLKQLNI